MKMKLILSTLLAFSLMIPATVSEAAFHSSSRSSFHSSSSHSSSYRTSSPSRSSSYSSSKKSYSSPSSSYKSGKKSYSSSSSKKVNLNKSKPKSNTYSSKSTTSKPKTKGTFSGKTSTKTKPKKAQNNYKKSSTVKKTSGSFSGKTSVKGKTYKSKPTRVKYKNRYVHVSHYYNSGYSPSGWVGYYQGMTTGMMMGSLFHPFGHTYPVNGQYVSYGVSPISLILDFIILMTLIAAIIVVIKMYRNRKGY
ncbi:hypothetical protein ABEY43_06735 [Priestia megaterium]